MFTRNKLSTWLVTAFVAETFCATYGLRFTNIIPWLAVLYFVSGLAIAVLWLYYKEANLSFKPPIQPVPSSSWYKLVLMGIMGVMMYHFSKIWMEDNPLLVENADMLPIIRTMGQRFIKGSWSHVYDIIPEIWGGMKPIYLPAMWLPFSVPEWLHIDIRWTTIVVFFLAFSVCIWMARSINSNAKLPVIIACAFALFWWLFTAEDAAGLIPYTEEGVVIGFYVLLTLALLKGNYWFIGIAISMCVLSRYVLIGWIPAMGMYLLLQKEYKAVFKLAVTGIACFLLLMVIPFGWKTFTSLVQLPSAYISFTARVWNDSPIVFSSSLGFARFFGPDKIILQHNMLVYLSFITPSVFMFGCWWMKVKQQRNLNNLLLATLKLTLVIFYSFIDVPYLYLFYTSSFISLVGIVYFISKQEKEAVA